MQAGTLLARRLISYKDDPQAIVLALPRGGVPVGFSIAKELRLPLDILIVRKLGLPGREEYAIGAVAKDDMYILQPQLLHQLGISKSVIEAIAERELHEVKRREKIY